MRTWKTLLLVYDRIDISYQDRHHGCIRFKHTMTDQELRDGIKSFGQFPHLVENLTSGRATIKCDVVQAPKPLATLSQVRDHQYWPSPDDARSELMQFATLGKYQSILVYWPQHNFREGVSIPSDGWGYGMGASAWSNNATYATVANAHSWAWKIPLVGEVWLHEWLHGRLCRFCQTGAQNARW